MSGMKHAQTALVYLGVETTPATEQTIALLAQWIVGTVAAMGFALSSSGKPAQTVFRTVESVVEMGNASQIWERIAKPV